MDRISDSGSDDRSSNLLGFTNMATFDDFQKLDIRVGTIVAASPFQRQNAPPIGYN